jgi:LacI family transcriptional regulator
VTLVSDDAQGTREAVQWLIGLGRTRIAHVTGPQSFASVLERASAFRAVAGVDAPVLYGSWSEAWGHDAVDRLWAGDIRPDAIFCGNDQIARGVIDALRERNVGVPEEVSVVGFDNWEIVAAASRPPLTTVDMNLKQLGREAGRLILALAEGRAVEPGIRKLPCQLVVRQSCGGQLRS